MTARQQLLTLTVEPHAVPLHASVQEAETRRRRLYHAIDRDVIVKPGTRLVQARVVFLVFRGQKQEVQPTVPCVTQFINRAPFESSKSLSHKTQN